MADILELAEFYKQTNAKTRAPDTLKRGQEYIIKKLYQVRSKYPDKDQQKPIKLVATFEQYKILWCVFLPKVFDNMDVEIIKTANENIDAKQNIRLVYYGKAGNVKMVKILKEGEEVDQVQVDGLWELEQMTSNSPPKRDHPDDSENSSPSKAIKLE